MAKTAAQYHPDIFPLVEKIGKLAQMPVALYAYVSNDKKYYKVIPENLDTYVGRYGVLDPPHTSRLFAVAKDGGDVLNQDNIWVITKFRIAQFPGCCALCISTGTVVFEDYRSRGVNTVGIQLRLALAGAFGYTALLASDVTSSPFSIKTLERAGFKKIAGITNKRTDNNLQLYIKQLD